MNRHGDWSNHKRSCPGCRRTELFWGEWWQRVSDIEDNEWKPDDPYQRGLLLRTATIDLSIL